MSRPPSRSQAHTGPFPDNCRSIPRRVGSAAAWSRSTSGLLDRAMPLTILTIAYIVNGRYSSSRCLEADLMTEQIHELVRERYAASAIALLDQGSACCAAGA